MRGVAMTMALLLVASVAAAQRLAAIPDTLEPVAKALASDTGFDTSAFWEDIEQLGSPIITMDPQESNYRLVTMLFRGEADTQAVLLRGPLAEGVPSYDTLSQLGESDIWFATYRFRSDTRGGYSFMAYSEHPNRILPSGRAPRGRPHRDTYNARRVGSHNLLALPDAPPDTWHVPREGVPSGEILEVEAFKSEILDNERAITIYTPHGYAEAKGPYPLALMFDRSAYLREMNIPVLLDNAISEGRIPPAVAVLVGNVPGGRIRELGANEAFARFIGEELMPWMRARYTISDEPRDNVIAGSSFGGLASVFVASRYPHIFGSVYPQAGSFWWAPGYTWAKPAHAVEGEFLAREFIEKDIPPLRFYIEVGLYDGGYTRTLISNRHFRDIAQLRGHTIVDYVENAGGHDYNLWRTSLVDGLDALLNVGEE